uniref:Uncharacterized protein n=1 Tax=Canis lupus familiaris TaxID=9615 RepID=A0A8C0Q7F0_CANLF
EPPCWIHLGGFHPLAVVNAAARNMGMQRPLLNPVFDSFEYTTRSGTAGSLQRYSYFI